MQNIWIKSGQKRGNSPISCCLASPVCQVRNHELQEGKEHDQAAYSAKADEGAPLPAKQEPDPEMKVWGCVPLPRASAS